MFVLSVGIESGLNVLDITAATVVDIVMRVALCSSEWVVDVTSRIATMLEVTELVNLEGMKTWLQSGELSCQFNEIVNILLEFDTSRRLGVSEEVELARGSDSFGLWGLSEVVGIDGLGGESDNISGTMSTASHPGH